MIISASVAALCFLFAAIALIWLIFRAFRQHLLWGAAVTLFSPVSATAYGIKFWGKDKKPFLFFIVPFVIGITLFIHSFHLIDGFGVVQLSMDLHRGLQSRIFTDREALEFAYVNYPVVDKSNPFMHNQRKLDLINTFIDKYTPIMTREDKHAIDLVLQDIANAPRLAFRQKREIKAMRLRLLPATEPETAIEDTVSLPTIVGGQNTSAPKRYRLAYIPIQPGDAKNYIGASVKVIRKNKMEKEYILTDTSPGRLHLVKKKQGGSFSFKLRHQDIERLRVLVQQAY
jgi:hypothetical protein